MPATNARRTEQPPAPPSHALPAATTPGAAADGDRSWTPSYSPWRHGGWYVDNIRYPSGAVGCVSRNYPDRTWRIVCDRREHDHTYPSRDDAARAERELATTTCPSHVERYFCDFERGHDDLHVNCAFCLSWADDIADPPTAQATGAQPGSAGSPARTTP